MSVKRKYNKADIHISGQYVPAKKGKFIVDAEYVRDDRTDESLLNSLKQIDRTVEETSQEMNERIDGMFKSGKIKSELLPSYVDDIIEGYYYNGAFYLDSEHTQEIQGESGKIYSDISVTPAVDYRWGGSAYVVHHAQADWNQSDAAAPDYIKNKPTIPAVQIQSDWNQTDNHKLDYIKNKPNITSSYKQSSHIVINELYSSTGAEKVNENYCGDFTFIEGQDFLFFNQRDSLDNATMNINATGTYPLMAYNNNQILRIQKNDILAGDLIHVVCWKYIGMNAYVIIEKTHKMNSYGLFNRVSQSQLYYAIYNNKLYLNQFYYNLDTDKLYLAISNNTLVEISTTPYTPSV